MGIAATVGLLAATFAVLFLLERRAPLRGRRASLRPRLWVNAVVSVIALVTAAALVRPAAEAMLDVSRASPVGLMALAGLSGPLEVAASFLLMDLTFYYWHVANHRIAFLWRLHNVHHIDPDLDVSTAFRFHFGEVALSALFRAAQVLAIGPSILAFAVYEVAFQVHTLFHHSNWRLPIALERALSRLIVTPRMHGIHHSAIREENRSNFGVVFSVWDALHRTLRLNVPQDEVRIGIPGYSQPQDNRVVTCLALPFRRQRDYWQGSLRRDPEAPRDASHRLEA
jgi:sterol desaturase/sphingolipid hydroxylase (fatty acid hydroxylase superfamily)